MATDLDGDDAVAPYTPPPPDVERERILKSMLAALKGACQPDTMTRVRLTGPLTRRQFHHLPLAEIARFGRSEAFSLELDTSGLMVEPAQQEAASGPLSLNAEIDRLVEEIARGWARRSARRALMSTWRLVSCAHDSRQQLAQIVRRRDDPVAAARGHAHSSAWMGLIWRFRRVARS